jgi:hypothetical protein
LSALWDQKLTPPSLPTSDNSYWLTGDVNKIIQTPVETAIHRYDPIIFLLVGLGASLNIGIRRSYDGSWVQKASLLETVEAHIKKIDKELENLKPSAVESMEVDNADQPEWKTWLIKSNKTIKDFGGAKASRKQQDEKLISSRIRMKDYLEEVRALLKEKKAKTWNEIHPHEARKESDGNAYAQQIPVIPFQVWSSDWFVVPVLQEKVSLYEELYEACWNGDDDKIRELCLPPPEGTTRKIAPIQIVCKTTEGGRLRPWFSAFRSTLTPLFTEFTPLHVAIHRRHWSTANTVMTVAAAQQRTKPEATATVAFKTLDINLGQLVPLFLF